MSILTIFFSQTGNTKKLAGKINGLVGGDIIEISESGVAAADLAKYDVVFVGTPNWAATVSGPVKTYLTGADLSGKTVVPFCTHGMGGLQNVAADITALCPNSKVLGSFAIKGVEVEAADAKLPAWLREIGIL